MFPRLTLSGPPYERGLQHGTQARPQIERSIATYAMLFAHDRGLNWDECQEYASAYLPLLEAQTPDLLAEMQGIAVGSGASLHAIVALNARTELLAGHLYDGMHARYGAALEQNRARGIPHLPVDLSADAPARPAPPATDAGPRSECTMVAATPAASAGGATWLAQTWDWLHWQREACVVLHVLPGPGESPPALLMLSEAGMVGKIGLNSAGLGVALNILSSRADGQATASSNGQAEHLPSCLPIHVQLRRVLHCRTVAEALALLQAQQWAASSTISLADSSGRVVSLEATPTASRVIEPENGLLVHTNHCLHPATQAGENPISPVSSTLPRYERARELLAQQRGQVSAESLMHLLRDEQGAPRCICRTVDGSANLHPADQVETVAAVVMDVGRRVLHLAPHRPTRANFVALTL